MVLLTTLPGATYVAQTAFHAGFDPATLALVCCLVAVAAWYTHGLRSASDRDASPRTPAEPEAALHRGR